MSPCRTRLAAYLAAALTGAALVPADSRAQSTLTDLEQRIIGHFDADTAAAIALLQRTVDINSGTSTPPA